MTVRVPDGNGWYEIAANPLSKVGIFDYRGASVGDKENPDRIYKVLRPAEELGDPNTLASFRLVPWIEDHVMLGVGKPGYVPAEQKGVHGVTGENIWFDATCGTMFGNIKVFSTSLQQKIDGGKVDLSLGYNCQYDKTPGVYENQPYDCVQRNIRGNHMALVADGRMGDNVAVMDSFVVTFDAKDVQIMATRNEKWLALQRKRMAAMTLAIKNKKPISGPEIVAMDAEEAEAGAPTLEDVAGLLKDVLPQIADINAAMADAAGAASGGDDDMEPEMDEAGQPVMDEAGKPKMKKKVPPAPAAPAVATDKAPTMDAMDAAIAKAMAPLLKEITSLKSGATKSVLAEVGQRDAMASNLSKFVGTFDHSEMTLAEVASYGVTKLAIPASAGHEVSAVNAWLHGREAPRVTHTMDSAAGRSKSLNSYLSE